MQQDVKHGLKLYVKRVFIMDDATQFLPNIYVLLKVLWMPVTYH